MLLATDVGALAISHGTGMYVDGLSRPGGTPGLLWGLVVVALLVAVARGLWRLAVFGAARRIESAWRERLASHWLALPAKGLEASPVGARIAMLTGDVQAIRAASGEGVMAAYDGGTLGLLALAYLAYAGGPWLAGAALLPLAIVLPILLGLSRLMGPAYEGSQRAYGKLSEKVQEAITGIRVVKGFGAEGAFRARLAEANLLHRQAQVPVWRLEAVGEPLVRLAMGLSLALALWVGGGQVARGELSVGQLVAFTATLSMLAWPLHAAGWALGLWAKGKAAMGRLEAHLAEEEGPVEALGAVSPAAQGPGLALRVEGLTWRALAEGPALLGPLDLDLKPGEWLGVFGPVGAGKSLLLELLCRWREASEGQVLLDGQDIQAWPLAELRRAVALVAQAPHVLGRGLDENLALRPGPVGEEAMWAALAAAQLGDEAVAWPEGLKTFLGERGRLLSGGQRQRLEVARAILAQPRLVLLDDPFSALDASTEARLREALRASLGGATVVLVAHRTAALAACDRILVLEGGRPVALAPHEALLAQGGAYAEVYALERARAQGELLAVAEGGQP